MSLTGKVLASAEKGLATQLGGLVAAFREEQQLTQKALAHGVGCPRTAIALLEQGHRLPKPDTLRGICRELSIPEELWRAAVAPVSYTHLRAHETPEHLVC